MTDPARTEEELSEEEKEAKRARKRARRESRDRRGLRRWRTLHAAGWILARLPLPVAAVLGQIAGRIVWWLSPGIRARLREQLDIAFGSEMSVARRRAIGARCLGLVGRSALSFLVLHRMGPERALARVTIVGEEHMDRALAKGRGVVVVSYHFGLFELAGSWLGVRKGGAAVGRETPRRDPTAYLTGLRADLGCPTVQRGDAREIIRVLRDGRPIAFVADQDLRAVNGVFVPFFGRLAHTPVGPVALALRMGAPIVVLTIEWTGLTTHRLTITPLPDPDAAWSREESILRLTHAWTQHCEATVRARPDHWAWLHRRWATRPEDRPEAPHWEGDG